VIQLCSTQAPRLTHRWSVHSAENVENTIDDPLLLRTKKEIQNKKGRKTNMKNKQQQQQQQQQKNGKQHDQLSLVYNIL
jgi:hypothetical protein